MSGTAAGNTERVDFMDRQAKRILLINDLPGYGKVALAAMNPILSRLGHFIMLLPTAVISNTLDYGKFRIQDMTEYMRDTMAVWEELDFDPDCICTGFVLSKDQVELIGDYIRSRKPDKKRLVLVDPIMADGGKLYNGIGTDRVNAMRKLVSYADVMVPNITEASFLTGIRPGTESGTEAEIRELLQALHKISGKSAVITSAERADGSHLVCGYDHTKNVYFEVPYEYQPVKIAGTGDIFSAILTGALLDGQSLESGVKRAVFILNRMIVEYQGHLKGYKGILLEQYLELLDKEMDGQP